MRIPGDKLPSIYFREFLWIPCEVGYRKANAHASPQSECIQIKAKMDVPREYPERCSG